MLNLIVDQPHKGLCIKGLISKVILIEGSRTINKWGLIGYLEVIRDVF